MYNLLGAGYMKLNDLLDLKKKYETALQSVEAEITKLNEAPPVDNSFEALQRDFVGKCFESYGDLYMVLKIERLGTGDVLRLECMVKEDNKDWEIISHGFAATYVRDKFEKEIPKADFIQALTQAKIDAIDRFNNLLKEIENVKDTPSR